ncbi:MAG: 16S rRNA (guanine(527)-N(7))-methyltransferase RsmG [Caldimonas sp.]
MASRRQVAVPKPTPDLQGAAAALGLVLSETQSATLVRFLRMLERWNVTYNLTAVRDPAQMLTLHMFDCLVVVPWLHRHLGGSEGKRLLDVGSGGGLPGVVLAIADPALEVVCVDAVGKKAAFVTQAAAELGLPNLTSIHSRVEQMAPYRYDVITSRAYASLSDFVQSTRSLLSETGVWLAMKGKIPREEIAALPQDVEVFHVEQIVVPGLQAERCLVWMRAPH